MADFTKWAEAVVKRDKDREEIDWLICKLVNQMDCTRQETYDKMDINKWPHHRNPRMSRN